jgi:hypothetical protein
MGILNLLFQNFTFFIIYILFKSDLKTITERLKTRYYCHIYLFRADVIRLFTNCREIFAPDSEQVKCANQLQAYFEKKLIDAGFSCT